MRQSSHDISHSFSNHLNAALAEQEKLPLEQLNGANVPDRDSRTEGCLVIDWFTLAQGLLDRISSEAEPEERLANNPDR